MTTETNAPGFDPFAGGSIVLSTDLTGPQQEVWLAIELGGDEASLAYNESVSLRIVGNLDTVALEQAIDDLVLRHEALRMTFSRDGSALCVEAEARAKLNLVDLSDAALPEREQQRQAIVSASVTQPFDLVRGPLFRPQLLKLDAERYELVLTAHHLICDGWSTGVIVSELPELYVARKQKRSANLPPAPKFSDYVAEELSAMHGPQAADAERFWLGALGNSPSTLELPTDYARPVELVLSARREDWFLPQSLVDGLRGVAKRASATLVATLLGALDAWLYRVTGQCEFAVGMPAAGQAATGMAGLVGHCVNTLPLPVKVDPQQSFLEHVRAIKRTLLDAAEHQRLSFGELLQKLDVPRDATRIPLIPVLFNLDQRFPDMQFGDAKASFVSNPRVFERFELFFNGTETAEGITLETTYNTSLFEHGTVIRWLTELTELLKAIVRAPDTPLGSLRVLPDAERECLLSTWNDTAAELPPVAAVIDLIEAQVARTPNAVAVRDDKSSLTYDELNQRANHVATLLRQRGVNKGDCVGVCVDRGTRLVVALLAVWKADAAYVPLDPDYPRSRLQFVLEDANIRCLVTEHPLADVIEQRNLDRVWIDEESSLQADSPARAGDPRTLAYVLHTSGSTGTPKGVQIEQRALVNFLTSMTREPGLTANDVLVAVTTLSFDIAGLELYLPLTVGARVVLASRETAMEGSALATLLDGVNATVLQATPATWRLLIEANWRGNANFKALCGGEALPRELANEIGARVGSLWNLYGPTETTIWSTCARIEPGTGSTTIGRPIANTTVYVLDPQRQLVPIGSVGELYIGGTGLARGYLNRPELTAERFVPDPFSATQGARLYRTGDLVRYDAQGRLYFERRNDGQVKVRGFRIELGEIECALDKHPTVRQSAVIVHEFSAGDIRLLAYVVPGVGATIDVHQLEEHLRAHLPPYMVPQHLIVLQTMPLTANGKVDRKALPLSEVGRITTDDYVAPVTPIESTLSTLWAELLHVNRVGIRDSFFALGGHSMLAVRMLNRLRESFAVDIPLRTVFRAQTISELAGHVEAALLLSQAQNSKQGRSGNVEEVDF